jgi:chromosome segregation ATPase
MKQLQDLKQQIYQAEGAEADSEIDTLKKQVSKLESDLAKKATKRTLAKKVSELSKKMSEAAEEGEEAEEGEQGEESDEDEDEEAKPSGPVDVVSKRKGSLAGKETHETEASPTSNTPYGAGKGIVAVDELQKDALGGPDYGWFKDILKAKNRLVGIK